MNKSRWVQAFAILVLFSTLICYSCNKENAPDCLQSAGPDETERRSLEAFTDIELRDYIQVELYDTNAFFIEVSAPRNLIPEITTELVNGKLRIDNQNTCNFVRSYKRRIRVRIYAPDFGHIHNYGTGDITSINTVESSCFKIENHKAAGTIRLSLDVDSASLYTHTGVCDIITSGTCGKTMLFNQGLGFIDARNLVSSEAYVNNSSINDVYVNSTGYLFAYLRFSGNIYYTGSPTWIDREQEGSGSIVELQ